jgi:hypothetical protein
LGVRRQRHKHHVLSARLLDAAAGEDPARVREQDDLQQDAGIVGRGTGVIVAIQVIERREVNVVVDEMVEGVFKRAGKDLAIEGDRKELVLVVGSSPCILPSAPRFAA